MKVVLDTSVLIAAFRSRNGASAQVLDFATQHVFITLATPALFLEYEEVLLRPKEIAAHGIPPQSIAEFLSGFAEIIRPVNIHFQWRPQLTDADDEMVLEAALNGSADAIITHNARDFASVSRNFKLRILSPREFLNEVSR